MERNEIDYCMPIVYDGIETGKYGIYKDGTVVNFDTKYALTAYMKNGGKVVDLYGYKKVTQAPITKLLAMVYVKKTEKDIERKRTHVTLIDPTKKATGDNVKWVNKLELDILNKLREKEELSNVDYVVPICRLLSKGYDVDEIREVLGFDNKLYIHNIKNRRIHKEITKDYKW